MHFNNNNKDIFQVQRFIKDIFQFMFYNKLSLYPGVRRKFFQQDIFQVMNSSFTIPCLASLRFLDLSLTINSIFIKKAVEEVSKYFFRILDDI